MQYVRWFLYSLLGAALVVAAIFLVVEALEIAIQVVPREMFVSNGIIWLLRPVENSHSSDGNGFVYEGKSATYFSRVASGNYPSADLGEPSVLCLPKSNHSKLRRL